MTPEACRVYARYNRWMNNKVYAAAARLSDEERKRDRGALVRMFEYIRVAHIVLPMQRLPLSAAADHCRSRRQ